MLGIMLYRANFIHNSEHLHSKIIAIDFFLFLVL